MKSVVVGTGRCGTGWLAAALHTYGLRYGHEAVFDHLPNSGSEERWRDYDGDSSLAAWRYLDRLESDTRIIRLMRHPRDTAYSWLGKHFFADTCPCHEPLVHRLAPYAQWIDRELPFVYQENGEIDRCVRYLLDVNVAIDAAVRASGLSTIYVRLEDLSLYPSRLDDTARFAGGTVPAVGRPTWQERNIGTPRVVNLERRLVALAQLQGYDW